VKSSNTRQLDKEARRILIASGGLSAASGLVNLHFGHPLFALIGFGAAVGAVVLYPWLTR